MIFLSRNNQYISISVKCQALKYITVIRLKVFIFVPIRNYPDIHILAWVALMSNDCIDTFMEYGVHVPTRCLYLEQPDGEIDHDTAARLIKGLHILEGSKEPITLLVNSGGGSVPDGIAIYSAIKQSHCPVDCFIYGQCSSMASIVIQACRLRVSAPETEFLLHDGTDSLSGNSRDVIKQAEALKRACELSYVIYASRARQPREFWRRKLVTDFILTAQEALQEGLIDEIR